MRDVGGFKLGPNYERKEETVLGSVCVQVNGTAFSGVILAIKWYIANLLLKVTMFPTLCTSILW